MIKNFKLKNKNSQQGGFTIIEIIIAIFILSVAVIGVFNAFSIMDTLSSDATDRLTATYLSQEGIEIIRNIRDTNWLTCLDGSCTWSYGLDGTNPSCTAGYEADITNYPHNYLYQDKLLSCWAGDGDELKINSDGFYGYFNNVGDKLTKFKRKITIFCLPDQNDCVGAYALKVVSEVFWKQKANIISSDSNPSIKVEEILYNWY